MAPLSILRDIDCRPSNVALRFYRVNGKIVRELLNEPRRRSHFVTWGGVSDQDLLVTSGIYSHDSRWTAGNLANSF